MGYEKNKNEMDSAIAALIDSIGSDNTGGKGAAPAKAADIIAMDGGMAIDKMRLLGELYKNMTLQQLEQVVMSIR